MVRKLITIKEYIKRKLANKKKEYIKRKEKVGKKKKKKKE
jgi:hypothetical protein